MSACDNEAGGYGRPPKQHQFKPGQSGNPKGRPKGSRNLVKILDDELDQKVPVTEGGKRRRVSKRQLAVRQQVNKAAQGDGKAFEAIMRMQQRAADSPAQADEAPHARKTELTEQFYLAALKNFRLANDGETEQ